MSPELMVLLVTAAFIGFLHTLLGPDHYLPFIVMGKAKKWSMLKTTWNNLVVRRWSCGKLCFIGFYRHCFGICCHKIGGSGVISRQPCSVGTYCLRTCVFRLGDAPGIKE